MSVDLPPVIFTIGIYRKEALQGEISLGIGGTILNVGTSACRNEKNLKAVT